MAGKVRHLLHARGRYSARVAVPVALRPAIGKRELLAPLGPDRTVALRRLPVAVAEMQATLEAARAQAAQKRPATPAPRGRPLTAAQMARQHYQASIAFDQEAREADSRYSFGYFDDHHIAVLKRAVTGAASNDELEAVVGHILAKFRTAGHTKVAADTPDFRQTAMALAVAELESLDVSMLRDEGELTAASTHPLLAEEPKLAPVPGSPRIIGPNSMKPLSELLPLLIAEKAPSPGSVNEYGVAVRMLEEFLGEARPVHAIVRHDVLGFKRALMETPANYTKRFPDTALPDAITANKARKTPFPVLNAKTINAKYLSRLHSLLKWCVNNDAIPDNPASGIKVDQAKATAAPRVPFTPGDLTKIFAAPLLKPGVPFGERQWATLIALHTGFRASEIAQLKLDSVRHERGILVLAVEEATKTRGSVRLTPVHSTLLRLGLEDRVEAMRKAGETHLFPDWYRRAHALVDSAGGRALNQPYSQVLPRWFNRTYLPSVGIVDGRKVFHSFRHTLKTALARAGVPRSVSDEITGHDDSTAGAKYVHETSIEAMKAALEKVHFDGLDLKAYMVHKSNKK